MEAAGLALIVLVSAAATVLVETRLGQSWPGSARRAIEGVAIAGTLVGLIYSPWGRQSGAHFNPAVTLTFLALGRVKRWDAVFYSAAHFAGALAGIVLAGLILGMPLRRPPVTWIVTEPGAAGIGVAFAAEFAISGLLMTTILSVGGSAAFARFTGVAAGTLVFLYICFEAPLSGFSMNPARTFASAAAADRWAYFWIYALAPLAGMLTAALINRRAGILPMMACAKLIHDSSTRCIHCGFTPARKADA